MTVFSHDSSALAEAYDRVSDLQFESGKRLVERLGVGEGARVLDVGCGTGRLARWIGERVGSSGAVAGIDPVEERIQVARSRGGGAQFGVGQAEDLGAFADASFDAVCLASVLHWVSDKAKALAEARRVLRPGGLLGVTTVARELSAVGTVGAVLESVLSRAPYAGRVEGAALTFVTTRCTTTELVSLVLDAGLELVQLQLTQGVRTYASGDAIVDFMEASAFGTFLRPVPDELRQPIRADLVAAFEARRGPEGVAVRGHGVLLVAARPG